MANEYSTNSFVNIYLKRRRELELDRMAKEQFERQQAQREKEFAEQQNLAQQTLELNKQNAARQAEQFATNIAQRQAELAEQRKLDVARMLSAGEIKPPGYDVQIPVAPGAQPGSAAANLPPSRLVEPGTMDYGGSSFVFRTPEERETLRLQALEDFEESRKKRRLKDLDELEATGAVTPNISRMIKTALTMGINPPQESLEEAYTAVVQRMHDPKIPAREATQLGRVANELLKYRQLSSIPYSTISQEGARAAAAARLREASTQLGIDPNIDLEKNPETLRRVLQQAQINAVLNQDKAAIQGLEGFDSLYKVPSTDDNDPYGYKKLIKDQLTKVPQSK